jgi:hypothetical protein
MLEATGCFRSVGADSATTLQAGIEALGRPDDAALAGGVAALEQDLP